MARSEGERDGLQIQLAATTSRLEASTEERNRLDVLCKRLKAQLADTKKLLTQQQDLKEERKVVWALLREFTRYPWSVF